MAKKLVPSQFKTHLINQMLESVDETANSIYYAFVGNHLSTGSTESEVDQPLQTIRDLNVETYRDMIFGKKFTASDFKIMLRRINWTSGTVYDIYDDQDEDLLTKDFFVAVDETAYTHVYKCLNNANGAESTVKPVFADVSYDEALFNVGDNYYETSDGYQWKYMFSIDSTTFNKFATQDYIPYVANTVTEADAVDGAIDVVKVVDGGENYNNYISGQFVATDISTGTSLQYRLPEDAVPVKGFYGNTVIHLISGTGAGQYKRIVTSNNTVGTTGRVYVQIEDVFATTPDSTTKYEISPEVDITGDGRETSNAVARALINANASNSVFKVEMLSVGENYSYATAEVLEGVPADKNGSDSGTIIEPTAATIRPIIPPTGGHGAEPAFELGGSALCLRMEFNKSESNTIPAENTFAQFGIIRDPLFANVEITHIKKSNGSAGSDGRFRVGEDFYQFKKIRLYANVTTTASNNTIVSNETDTEYDRYLLAGDYVYITSGDNTEYNYIGQVSSVINSTAFQTTSNVHWGSAATELYLATDVVQGNIKTVDSTFEKFNATQVNGKLVDGELVIGLSSFSVANVEYINVNNRFASNTVYDFSTFNQTTKCVGSIAGTFESNELVYQGDSDDPSMTAYIHSTNGSNEVYLTRVEGPLDTSKTLIGDSSGASLSAFDKYYGELDATSGKIIYLQNDVPVTREGNQSEIIRAILEF